MYWFNDTQVFSMWRVWRNIHTTKWDTVKHRSGLTLLKGRALLISSESDPYHRWFLSVASRRRLAALIGAPSARLWYSADGASSQGLPWVAMYSLLPRKKTPKALTSQQTHLPAIINVSSMATHEMSPKKLSGCVHPRLPACRDCCPWSLSLWMTAPEASKSKLYLSTNTQR